MAEDLAHHMQPVIRHPERKGIDMTAFQTTVLKRGGSVAHLTLNRPERLHALNRVALEEANLTLDAAGADSELRTVVVSGAGRAFSSIAWRDDRFAKACADGASAHCLDRHRAIHHRRASCWSRC